MKNDEQEYRSLETVNQRSNYLHDLVDFFYESHFPNSGLPYYDQVDTINVLLHFRTILEDYLQDYSDNIKIKSKR